MDLLDLFGDEQETVYGVQVWHYGTTEGVEGPGGSWTTPEAAQDALRAYTGQSLDFRELGDRPSLDKLAHEMYEAKQEVGIVYRRAHGDVVWLALLGGVSTSGTA